MARRQLLLASLLAAGCAQAPSSPPGEKTNFAPLRPVAPEETLPYPVVLVPPAPVTPVAEPVAPVVEANRYLAFTAWLDYYPDYGCGISSSQLFVYDDLLKDNYALPGAGGGIANPECYLGGRYIVFDRGGQILFYDVERHLACAFNNVNGCGPVARPSISEDGQTLVFVGYPGPIGPCGSDGGVAYLWSCGAVCELSKVNVAATPEGGVNWIRISADGRWAVFTTALGGLYLYDLQNPMVLAVPDVHDVGGFAAMPDISPDGTQLVFTALDRSCGRPTIFRFDRLSGMIDPLPFANAAFGSIAACNPQFLGGDGVHLYFQALSPEGCYPRFRVLEYDWITERVRTLTVLNSVTIGDTTIGQ